MPLLHSNGGKTSRRQNDYVHNRKHCGAEQEFKPNTVYNCIYLHLVKSRGKAYRLLLHTHTAGNLIAFIEFSMRRFSSWAKKEQKTGEREKCKQKK